MSEILRCAPPGTTAAQAAPLRLHRNGKTRVIDIHCHLNIPAADALLRPHATPASAMAQFSSPQSDAVNGQLFARIGPKLNSIETHLVDMDASGVDIQAIS